jgi:BirA family biotin operon repressor/biotin-[acetyl-CoA-carboxylase] ligase
MTDQLLNLEAIKRDLKTRVLGQSIVYLQSVDSTNAIAKHLADAGEPEGAIVLTDFQTAGRGRMARSWVAPARSSILVSLLLKAMPRPDQNGRLTMAVALGACEAIRAETELDAQIKWPNDILINGKKCAGILAEASTGANLVEYMIVGLGANVNFAATSVAGVPANATTIADELGREFPREQLMVALMHHIERFYLRLKAGEDLHAEWKSRLATLGQKVSVREGDRVVEGIAQDVDGDGALLVRKDNGEIERLIAGDVTLGA